MYRIVISEYFGKKLEKLIKKDKTLQLKVRKVKNHLKIDPFYIGLHTHKVKHPDFGTVYSSRVTGDLRIIWVFKNNQIIILMDIGGHSGGNKVYK